MHLFFSLYFPFYTISSKTATLEASEYLPYCVQSQACLTTLVEFLTQSFHQEAYVNPAIYLVESLSSYNSKTTIFPDMGFAQYDRKQYHFFKGFFRQKKKKKKQKPYFWVIFFPQEFFIKYLTKCNCCGPPAFKCQKYRVDWRSNLKSFNHYQYTKIIPLIYSIDQIICEVHLN